MRKLIPLLTAAILFSGGLAVPPRPAAAQMLPAVVSTEAPVQAVPVQAVPVHWDRGYGYGGGYYAPPPPPPPWYGRPHYRGGGGYGGGHYAPPPPPRWGGGGGWYR